MIHSLKLNVERQEQRVNTAFLRTSKDIDGPFSSSASNNLEMILCVTLKNMALTRATSSLAASLES